MCAGTSVDACGDACTKCTAPAGGTVDCVNRTCQGKCDGTQTLCDNDCVDTKTSMANCGRCGHSCNGAACSDSGCQPYDIAGGFTKVNSIAASPKGVVMVTDGKNVKRCGIATGCSPTTITDLVTGSNNLSHVTVAGSEVFWDGAPTDPWIIWHCPVDGCPPAGATQAESKNDVIGALVAGPSAVYWTRAGYYAPYSEKCTPPACTDISYVRPYVTTGSQYNSTAVPDHEMTIPTSIVSVGANTVLWSTGTLYNNAMKWLRSCALASTCTTPTEIATAPTYSVSALTYYSGKHYVASAQALLSVDDVANTTTTANIASDATGIVGIAVDASGIYWVNGTTGTVKRCPKLTGCTSGEVQTLATGQNGATGIAVDATLVYWALPTKVEAVVKP
jgi:hypothetical protein